MCISQVVEGQGNWTALQDFPQVAGRFGATSFTIGNSIYYSTGLNNSNGSNSENWAYNISTNTWSQKSTAAFIPRFYAVSFALGGKGYLGSGNLAANISSTPVASNDFYEYDPTTDAWALKNAIGPTSRYGAVAFVIQNKGYVSFGASSGVAQTPWTWVGPLEPSIHEYDPISGLWTAKNPATSISFPGTINAQSFVINNKAYVVAGFVPGVVAQTASSDGVTIRNTVEFDPSNNSWTLKSSLPAGYERHLGSSFSLLDRGYLAGGHIKTLQACSDIYACLTTPSVMKYNPYLNSWTIFSTATPFGTGSFARAASVTNCDFGFISTGIRRPAGVQEYNHLNFKYEDAPDAAYVNGPDLVCSTFDAQFILQLSSSGSVTWTTSSNLYIVSGQGTKNLNVRSNSNGSAWVQVSFNNGCRIITFPQRPTYAGPYSSSNYPVSGPSSSCRNQNVFYSTNTLAGATNYEWTWPSGWIYISGQGTPNLALKTGTSSGAVGVRVHNTCGQAGSFATKFTQVNSCGALSVSASPNPSTDYLRVSRGKTDGVSDSLISGPYEIVLFDKKQQKVYQTICDELNVEIPVFNLENGMYYLHVNHPSGGIKQRIEVKK